MADRTLKRPMFRRGGSTGEGIKSGLRLGYSNGGDLETLRAQLAIIEQEAPLPKTPKSTASADFWLNLGTNILAQPGGRPILQTLGTAGKEPLARYQQQRAQEGALKYKHGMSNRQFLLDAWKAMSDDDKTAMQKNIVAMRTATAMQNQNGITVRHCIGKKTSNICVIEHYIYLTLNIIYGY